MFSASSLFGWICLTGGGVISITLLLDIFLKSSQQLWLSEKDTKYFKEVNLAKSRKELHPYISEDPKFCIFLKPPQQFWLIGRVLGFFRKVFLLSLSCVFSVFSHLFGCSLMGLGFPSLFSVLSTCFGFSWMVLGVFIRFWVFPYGFMCSEVVDCCW